MATDLYLVASNITAALISSNAVSVKGQMTERTVEQAANLYSMVLTELMDRGRQNKLYKEP